MRPIEADDPVTGRPLSEISPSRAERIRKVREKYQGKIARLGSPNGGGVRSANYEKTFHDRWMDGTVSTNGVTREELLEGLDPELLEEVLDAS